jgi:hypothetical protein
MGFIINQVRPYKVYTALLTQSGTNPPTAIILENTFGEIPIFSYLGLGQYTISCSLFTNYDKIFCQSNPTDSTPFFCIWQPISIGLSGIATVAITGLGIDDGLNNTPFEIRIYN